MQIPVRECACHLCTARQALSSDCSQTSLENMQHGQQSFKPCFICNIDVLDLRHLAKVRTRTTAKPCFQHFEKANHVHTDLQLSDARNSAQIAMYGILLPPVKKQPCSVAGETVQVVRRLKIAVKMVTHISEYSGILSRDRGPRPILRQAEPRVQYQNICLVPRQPNFTRRESLQRWKSVIMLCRHRTCAYHQLYRSRWYMTLQTNITL